MKAIQFVSNNYDILAIIGLILVIIELFQVAKTRRRQFEQARREKTVEVVRQYSLGRVKGIKAIENIVANLTDDQCLDLYNGAQFTVSKDLGEKICDICPYKKECDEKIKNNKQQINLKDDAETSEAIDTKKTQENEKNTEITKSTEISTPEKLYGECFKNDGSVFYVKDSVLHFIRDNIISYLNSLECVLLAWELGIVDRKVIQDQFIFLDKKRQKERALEVFRSFAGNGRSYPTIEKFYLYLDYRRIQEAKKMKKLLK